MKSFKQIIKEAKQNKLFSFVVSKKSKKDAEMKAIKIITSNTSMNLQVGYKILKNEDEMADFFDDNYKHRKNFYFDGITANDLI